MNKFFLKIFNRYLGCLMLLALPGLVGAEQVEEGKWLQISSSANVGECKNCFISLNKETPDIVKMTSNNGWVGYVFFDKKKQVYSGFLQWKKPDSPYSEVFRVTLSYDKAKGRLVKKATDNQIDYWVVYKKASASE